MANCPRCEKKVNLSSKNLHRPFCSEKCKLIDLVKITNGQETQELKYKKAKPMIESGEWRIV